MKVTGFSFVKNAVAFDYPVVEAIKSILPICDDFVVAVGDSDDGTLELIQSIGSPKIRIIRTVWDENAGEGGVVLAQETDKALAEIHADSDWAFYIQGDEVVHEKYLDTIYAAMLEFKDAENVDGLLFKYLHFYASYDYVGASTYWYKNEIRVIKNNQSIYSYRDAQGFRKGDNKKLTVRPIDAFIHHYGWVREPEAMQKKQETLYRYWRGEKWVEENFDKGPIFDYSKYVTELKAFDGTHPELMADRIAQKNWKFDYDITLLSRKNIKDKLKDFLKNYLGLDFNYTNYIIDK